MDLRVYNCVLSKLLALFERFASLTLAIWERFGIRQVALRTTLIGGNVQQLVHLVAWQS